MVIWLDPFITSHLLASMRFHIFSHFFCERVLFLFYNKLDYLFLNFSNRFFTLQWPLTLSFLSLQNRRSSLQLKIALNRGHCLKSISHIRQHHDELIRWFHWDLFWLATSEEVTLRSVTQKFQHSFSPNWGINLAQDCYLYYARELKRVLFVAGMQYGTAINYSPVGIAIQNMRRFHKKENF